MSTPTVPDELLVAYYNAARDEEMERIKQRDIYIVYTCMAYAIIMYYYWTAENTGLFISSIPLISLMFSFMYAHTDITIGALSKWLGTEYANNIIRIYNLDNPKKFVFGRDGSPGNLTYYRSPAFLMRYYFLIFFCLVLNITTIISVIFKPIKLNAIDGGYITITLHVISIFSAVFSSSFIYWALSLRTQLAKSVEADFQQR